MPTRQKRSDDERALELIERLLAMGVTPRSIEVGDVSISVHSVGTRSADSMTIPPGPGPASYLEREMLKEKRRREGALVGRPLGRDDA